MNPDKASEDHSALKNGEIRKEDDISTRVSSEGANKELKLSHNPRRDQQYRDQATISSVPQNVPQQYRGQAPNSSVPKNIQQPHASRTNYYSKREGTPQRSSEINTPGNKYGVINPMTSSFYDNQTPNINKTPNISFIHSGGSSQGRSASYSDRRSPTNVQHRRRPCSYAGPSEEGIHPFYFKKEEGLATIPNTPIKDDDVRTGTQKQTSNEMDPTSRFHCGKVTSNEKQPSTSGGFEENVRVLPACSPSSSRPCSPVRVVSHSSGIPRTCSSLNSSVSEAAIVCRICHGDGRREQLLSPCYCAGSIGMLHLSCLQRWLGSSNKTHCELCNFQFTMEKRPKPFKTFIRNPGSAKDKRHIICDFVCFLVLTPLTISAVSFCLHGSLDTDTKKLESIGLSTLGASLFILYVIWLTVCIRHNVGLWRGWQQFNQDVKLKCHPPVEGPKLVPISEDGESSTMPSKGARRGTVKLCSIEINVTTSGDVSPRVKVSKKKTMRSPASPRSNTGSSPSPRNIMGNLSASTETTEHSKNYESLMNAGRMHRCISKETYV